MKKILSLICLILPAALLYSQALFTYGGNAVSKDEFLKAYNKNKTQAVDKDRSLRDYLELYTRFKLKVMAARQLHLDTLPQLKYDLQNFRNQVQDSYMNDEKGVNALIDEAFRRSQKDIRLMHFYVQVGSKMSPEDTLKAYKAMQEMSEEMSDKKIVDYDELVEDVSKKYVPIKGTDMGFITVFSIPYEYENVAYSLKLGQVCKPYRSKNAWHLFRLVEERKAAGKWKIAQIMLAFPPGDQTAYVKPMERKADSIYQALIKGADFATLAKSLSDDKLTYQNGGEMPEFGTGKFELPYERQVFALSKDGDIAKPFFTEFGYHIIKRLSVKPIPADKSNDDYMFDLKQKVLQDSRINSAKDKFTQDVIKRIGFKRNQAVKDADIYRYADSVPPGATDAKLMNTPISNKILFSFDQLSIKGSDWLRFVRQFKENKEMFNGESNKEIFEKYIPITALEQYKQHMVDYNPDFAYQMQEFKEGNMLFEIMERNVWGRASANTEELRKYYEEHKGKYTWGASADAVIYNCSSANVASTAAEDLKGGKKWRSYAEEMNSPVQADSGRYEIAQLPMAEGQKITEGMITPPLVSTTDGTTSFIRVLKTYPPNAQRAFEDAKGLVINDYQIVLEDQWISELKKKYPVKVNEAVFKSLLK